MSASKQARMFESEDLPLFSGAAPRAVIESYQPQEVARQGRFYTCPLCLDTGHIRVRGRIQNCLCGCNKEER